MDSLRRRARDLRNGATDAERHLWRHLRGRQLEGFRFRRQVPIGGYVVDFVCPQARLIVELDGGQHLEQIAYDERRTAVLIGLGYRVARYWNDDVLLRTEDVVADIHRQLTKSFTPPQPSPLLRKREGANSDSSVKGTPPQPSPLLRKREGANSDSDSDSSVKGTPPQPSPASRGGGQEQGNDP